jgi:serine/threonine protein kinase/tetratricopeptide (TPR) repeat protein
VAADHQSQIFRVNDLHHETEEPLWLHRVNGTEAIALSLSPQVQQTQTILLELQRCAALQPLERVFAEAGDLCWVYRGAGYSLNQSLHDGQQMAEQDAVQLLRDSLPTLTTLHDRGIIHGNLQPHSFFFSAEAGCWCLTHFGATYAPELIPAGQAAIAASGYLPTDASVPPTVGGDLYCLGVTILHALTGVEPANLTQDWRKMTPVSDRLAHLINLIITQYFSSAAELHDWLDMAASDTAPSAVAGSGQRHDESDPDPDDIPDQNLAIITNAKLDSEVEPSRADTGWDAGTANSPPLFSTQPEASTQTTLYLAHRYRVVRPLSRGGFGETYIAIDEQFPGHPTCIVKKLKLKEHTDKTYKIAKHLFKREADVLSRLGQHSQIPQLLAHFEEDQEFYLVEEFIDGHDLETELPPGKKLPEAAVRQLVYEMLEVLSVIHAQGIIHRDLKPANIRRRVSDRKLVLIDFGAVKQLSKQTSLDGKTKVTVAIGTTGYAPSEQTQGRPKLSSDIYAVGMIALQALTGLDPEQIPDNPKTSELQWHHLVKLTPGFQAFLERMVCYDFRQRFESAIPALSAFKHLDLTATTLRDRTPTDAHPQRRRFTLSRRTVTRIVGGVGVLGVAGIAVVLARSLGLFQPSLTQISATVQASTVVVQHPDSETALVGVVVEGEPYACTILTTQAAIAAGEGVTISLRQSTPQPVDIVEVLPKSAMVLLKVKQNNPQCSYPELALGNPDDLRSEDLVYLQATTADTIREFMTAPLETVPITNVRYSSLPGIYLLGYEPPVESLPGSPVVNRQGKLLGVHQGQIAEATLEMDREWAIPVALYRDYLDTRSELDNATAQTWLERGNQFFELQQYEEALAAYDETIVLEPDRPEPWYGLGSALYNLERYEEAIAAYNQVLAMRDDNTLAWYSKGNALFQLQQYEEAIAAYEGALKTKEDYYPAINNLGLAQQALERYAQAIATFERVINLRPEYHPAHNNLGTTFQQQGDYAKAITAYDQAIRIRPNYASAWYNRATAYARSNQPDRAIENLTRAIELQASFAEEAKTNPDFDSFRGRDQFPALARE